MVKEIPERHSIETGWSVSSSTSEEERHSDQIDTHYVLNFVLRQILCNFVYFELNTKMIKDRFFKERT